MGKRIIPQRRGTGSPRYRSPSHRFKGKVNYPIIDRKGVVGGQIVEFIHDAGRTAPVAKILLEDFREILMLAPEGVAVGDWVQLGSKAELKDGNVMPIKNIPEGTGIYNIELRPGDGGKAVRTSGGKASVVSHDKQTGLTQIRLPSKKTIFVRNTSLATIGKVAGGGRKDKPMIHAGQNYYKHKAKGKLWPKVCGRAMNAVDHPHGGGRHPHVGRATTVSRNTPPGRKVGHIAARRTGLRKKA
ncbi:MAG: 50S ribosomal protein L2 [Candidatus Altiarchaeota archaeon]